VGPVDAGQGEAFVSATHDLKRELVDALAMLEAAGVIDFNGHFSARAPDSSHLLINSGASVRSALSVSDIVEVDLDGRPLNGCAPPPMEVHIHTEIYRRRPDVTAVVHSHPVWSTVLGMAGHPVLPVTMQASVLGEVRRFAPIASINTKPLGEALAAELGSDRVVTLQSHGAVVAAQSVLEAFVLAIYLEENAYRQHLALQVGTPRVLDPTEIATIRANLWKPNLLRKVWDYHAAKLRRRAVAAP
jgi:ribulose-5-phosphate 4-epimerase/fuculose-1-phosphate aldolase